MIDPITALAAISSVVEFVKKVGAIVCFIMKETVQGNYHG
jgi:hypothetical protein